MLGIGDGLEQWQDQCFEFGLADPCRPKASIRSEVQTEQREYVAASISAAGQLCRFNNRGGRGRGPRRSDDERAKVERHHSSFIVTCEKKIFNWNKTDVRNVRLDN